MQPKNQLKRLEQRCYRKSEKATHREDGKIWVEDRLKRVENWPPASIG